MEHFDGLQSNSSHERPTALLVKPVKWFMQTEVNMCPLGNSRLKQDCCLCWLARPITTKQRPTVNRVNIFRIQIHEMLQGDRQGLIARLPCVSSGSRSLSRCFTQSCERSCLRPLRFSDQVFLSCHMLASVEAELRLCSTSAGMNSCWNSLKSPNSTSVACSPPRLQWRQAFSTSQRLQTSVRSRLQTAFSVSGVWRARWRRHSGLQRELAVRQHTELLRGGKEPCHLAAGKHFLDRNCLYASQFANFDGPMAETSFPTKNNYIV